MGVSSKQRRRKGKCPRTEEQGEVFCRQWSRNEVSIRQRRRMGGVPNNRGLREGVL